MREIFLAGGCFWGLQKYFDIVPGVLSTQAGYANGKTEDPTYNQVCAGNTGFAETVKIQYNELQIRLKDILHLFFRVVDPTVKNRQGNDVGEQYRTGIFYLDEGDRMIIDAVVAEEQKKYETAMVTEVLPLKNYYTAEEYHQNYLDKNPGGYCHIGNDDFLYAQNFTPEKQGELASTGAGLAAK